MSLVHDALQKAEREKLRKTGEVAPAAAKPAATTSGGSGGPAAPPPSAPVVTRITLPPPPAAPAPKPHRSLIPFLLAGLVVIGSALFIWIVLRSPPTARLGAGATAEEQPQLSESPAVSAEARPPESPPPPPPLNPDDGSFKLTGIMKNPDGTPCAIISGRVVSEGNYVDGAVVKQIERDRVLLDVNGREVVRRLN